jgi:hypothetical protein
MHAESNSAVHHESGVLSSETRRDMGPAKPDEDEAVTVARAVLNPAVGAAATLAQYGKSDGDLDLLALVESLAEVTRANNKGDLRRGEAMLTAQAHTLDAIFNHLAQRAAANMGEYLGATESYLKLALRAQSQCRATWEALLAIKNPPVVYARQANIAQGHQQVNNGTAPRRESQRTRENEIRQSKQSGDDRELLSDARTSQAESRIDPPLEALGEVDRAEDEGR